MSTLAPSVTSRDPKGLKFVSIVEAQYNKAGLSEKEAQRVNDTAGRLQNVDDLWIDCAGDEYDDPDSDVRFDYSPCFAFSDGRVKFGTRWFGGAGEDRGSASGFGPQK